MDFVISVVGSIFGSVAGKAAEYTVDPIAQQLGYLFKHETKFQNLMSQLQELKGARERVQHAVNEANRNGEEIFNYVEEWLTDVNGKITEEAETEWKEDEEQVKKRCFIGLCPNFKSRYQLGKKAENQANAIAQLISKEKESSFTTISYRPAPEVIPTATAKDFETFESRSRVFNGVMEALRDDNLSIIGVHGMGGVGKTTLVREVARQAKEKQLFDEVVLVTITQTPNIENIQIEIAERLGLKFVETSKEVRASRVRERLKKEKKVLIILDDIWVKLDLQALGIPSIEEHTGRKLLLTSRELEVLSSMGSQKSLTIGVLEGEEAWDLFRKMAGDIVLSRDLHPIAVEVAKKCAGLPIAIVTIGRAMRNKKHLFEWNDALRELRRPSKRNFRGIPADVYLAIELSYKFLEEEHQQTLILCSIMGHNAAIEVLLQYGMGLGLFEGVNTVEETRDKVLTLVSSLKNSSLLLDGIVAPQFFDMHDVVRDVALSITSRDYHWLALSEGDVFIEWSDEAKMRNCNLISLQHAEVNELPDELQCPNLTFFSMASEESSLIIPNNFFQGMQKLRVLDFTKMKFPSLPSSIRSLNNIHTLRLSDCILEDIAVIGELKNLEILDLHKSRIAVLPIEIGQLVKLKLLDLSDCGGLKVISPNVLSNLSRLEELYLYSPYTSAYSSWEVEGQYGIGNPKTNASLAELQQLSHLTTLEVKIDYEQAIPKDSMFFTRLKRYKVTVGGKNYSWEHDKTLRTLYLKLKRSIYSYAWLMMMLREVETLFLEGVEDAEKMIDDPNTKGFQHLKHLYIAGDKAVKHIINSTDSNSCNAFPLLELLYLEDLVNLETISFGHQLKVGSFGQLRVIKVVCCHMLKNLFSFSVAGELHQLQQIRVTNCKNMTGLIKEDDEAIDILEFSQLRSLKLAYLTRFICLRSLDSIDAGSQSISFLDQKIVFPNLQELDLYMLDSPCLWDVCVAVPEICFGLQNLTKLTVSECNNWKYLLPFSVAQSLVQLKYICITWCRMMEEVIVGTEGEEILMMEPIFPKLERLILGRLLKLTRFCSGDLIRFPFLTYLEINGCSVLETFICSSSSIKDVTGQVVKNIEATRKRELKEDIHPDKGINVALFDEKVTFLGVKELEVKGMAVEKLWHYDQLILPASVKTMCYGVESLTHLTISDCPSLKNVFSSSMVNSFVQLTKLHVDSCSKMEEIISIAAADEDEEEESSINSRLVFPKLQSITLRYLDNLKRFCGGRNINDIPIDFPCLSHLSICRGHFSTTFISEARTSSTSMENIIALPSLFNKEVAFPMQEGLEIEYVSGLERVWSHQYADKDEQSFSRLITLKLWYCRKLRNVFPLSMVTRLQRLNLLSIVGCESVEEIIEPQQAEAEAEDQAAGTTIEFPQLTSLELHSLPRLRSWYHKAYAAKWPSLKQMRVCKCDRVEILFANINSNSQHKKSFQVKGGKNQQEIPIQHPLFWINEFSFPNLVELEVTLCHGMKKLFTHSAAKSLVQLREMRIDSCRAIEEIVQYCGDDEVKDEMISFPKLKYLYLRMLSKLESFCSSGNIYTLQFPSLQTVTVSSCPKMKMFCLGELNTPMLPQVRFCSWAGIEEYRCEGNLNGNIQRRFKEENPEVENSSSDQGSSSQSSKEDNLNA